MPRQLPRTFLDSATQRRNGKAQLGDQHRRGRDFHQLPERVVTAALETIRMLGQDHTDTLIHGDLHFGITLGRTLKKRAADILAYFDRAGTSNGPTEAINGRLEHLRGSALGFRKPQQLHRPITPGIRRLQTPTTPCIVKSRIRSAAGPQGGGSRTP